MSLVVLAEAMEMLRVCDWAKQRTVTKTFNSCADAVITSEEQVLGSISATSVSQFIMTPKTPPKLCHNSFFSFK